MRGSDVTPRALQRLLQGGQIMRHARLHITADRGGDGALVFPDDRPDLARQENRQIRGRRGPRSAVFPARDRRCGSCAAGTPRSPRSVSHALPRSPASTVAGSKGRTTCPSASVRSAIGKTQSRVINGTGRRENRSYIFGILSRASSRTSENPAVANNASFSPFRWITVFRADRGTMREVADIGGRNAVTPGQLTKAVENLLPRPVGPGKTLSASRSNHRPRSIWRNR